MNLCKHCYKMALSLGTMLPVTFIYKDGTKTTEWPLAIAGAVFTPDHDKCECCEAQLRMVKGVHDLRRAEPDPPPEEFLKSTERCCCK